MFAGFVCREARAGLLFVKMSVYPWLPTCSQLMSWNHFGHRLGPGRVASLSYLCAVIVLVVGIVVVSVLVGVVIMTSMATILATW